MYPTLLEKNKRGSIKRAGQGDWGTEEGQRFLGWVVTRDPEALYLAAACSDFPASGPESWARDSKVTGMVISDDWVAGLGMGASTVSIPSGDREEETRVGSTPGGSLEHEKDKCYPPGDPTCLPMALPLP